MSSDVLPWTIIDIGDLQIAYDKPLRPASPINPLPKGTTDWWTQNMRLWNAHQRVILKRKLPLQRLLRLEKKIDGWRQILSEDVIKYIDDLDMENLAGSAEERNTRITTITRNPAMFFSRPKNVPLEMRKQVYLYICLLPRTSRPKLTFEKL